MQRLANKELENAVNALNMTTYCEVQSAGDYEDVIIGWDGMAAIVCGLTAERIVKYILHACPNYSFTDISEVTWDVDEIQILNLKRN